MAKAKKKSAMSKEVSPENKANLKAAIKELKVQKAAAMAEGDKKKLKALRYKIKKTNLVLKRTAEALGKINAAKAAEAKAAEA